MVLADAGPRSQALVTPALFKIPSALAPPLITEAAVGALSADCALREAFLGDLAEEFAHRCDQHGQAHARRWYRRQAIRSVPYLLAASWWPAASVRCRRLRTLLGGVVGGYLTLLLLHQAAQVAAGQLLFFVGRGASDWAFASCSLAAGVGCAVVGGLLAARTLPEAPLAAALALAASCVTLAVTGMLINGGVMPLWYWGGFQLLLAPLGACLGGLLRARQQAQLKRSL
jgi:hypothetical protein